MNMEFVDLASPEKCGEYEKFINNHPGGSFTQSLYWSKVKQGWLHEVIVIRNDQQKIIAAMLVLIRKIPFLRTAFLYSPRGPVCDLRDSAVLRELREGIAVLAKKYDAYLFKCDPFVTAQDTDTLAILKQAGFIHQEGIGGMQCTDNYVLDIKDRSMEEIFESFHKKWRYNIRLSEKKGVVCEYYEKCREDKLDDFYKLMEETGNRDGFFIRPKDYFRSMINCFDGHCRLYLCYFENIPVSGAIAVQYGKKTCYVYGASACKYRSVMPNHLMQWSMIQWAVENGDDLYDFMAIPNYNDETHPKYGIYQFKKGFNGRVVNYAGEFDMEFSKVKRNTVNLIVSVLKHTNRLKSKLLGK